YLAVPDRDQYLSRSPAKAEDPEGRTGAGRNLGRTDRPYLHSRRRPRSRRSGKEPVEPPVKFADLCGARAVDPARTDGVRVETLSGDAAADYRRDSGYDRRGRQELFVPSHPKDARGIGRLPMNCDLVKEQIALYVYGELAAQEEEDIEQHLHDCGACRAE